MDRRFSTLWAVWLVPALAAGGEGVPARVLEVADARVEVLAEPADSAFATAVLHRGDRVEVRKVVAGGWVAIAAPRGSFHWVDEADVEPLRDGRLYVKAPRTLLRFGSDGADRPGPPRRMLLEGTVVAPADRPPLVEPGRRRKVWLAVAAGADEVRFVRASGLVDPRAVAASEPEVRRASHAQDPPKDRAGLEAEMAKAESEFDAIVHASRQRDAVVERVNASLRDVRAAEDLAYDAEGLLQPTSLRVDGEKVFALIDRRGLVATYVRLPAGLDSTNLVAHPVGVRGKSHFDEGLKFRLVDARDVEALDAD